MLYLYTPLRKSMHVLVKPYRQVLQIIINYITIFSGMQSSKRILAREKHLKTEQL